MLGSPRQNLEDHEGSPKVSYLGSSSPTLITENNSGKRKQMSSKNLGPSIASIERINSLKAKEGYASGTITSGNKLDLLTPAVVLDLS